MLTHPSILLSKKYKNHYGKSCSLRFQQSLVDVYVKFYIATSAGYDYFINRQAALKITHLLKNQMRVADRSFHWTIIPPKYPRWKAIWFQVPLGRLRLPRREGSHSSSVSVSKVKVVSAFTPNFPEVNHSRNTRTQTEDKTIWLLSTTPSGTECAGTKGAITLGDIHMNICTMQLKFRCLMKE